MNPSSHVDRPRMVLRNRYLFSVDLLLIPMAIGLSFALRFEDWRLWDFRYGQQAAALAFLALLVKPVVYYACGLYAQVWRHAGWKEAQGIIVAVSAASAVLAASTLGLFLPQGLGERLGLALLVEFPRSVLAIDWLLSMPLAGIARAAIRLLPAKGGSPQALALHQGLEPTKRVLVAGAGEAGAKVVHEILQNPGLGLVPMALVDDDPKKLNMFIHGVQVRGSREDIPLLVRRMGISDVIIALPTAPGREIRAIAQICQEVPVRCRVVPGLFELIDGRGAFTQLREPRIEDLLRRQSVTLEMADYMGYLEGATVLVTGAGGSIGSELCRQSALRRPRKLILLGHGENSIYKINMELAERFPDLALVPVIADIRNRARIRRIFKEYQPDVVFHAAAHKHVPLMEDNAEEVIGNNVFGTRTVLQASLDSKVGRFVFVSSDKAVNPVSMLGVSKRLGEMMVLRAASMNGGTYLSVRFGNVLGSRGSVVPLFLAQIEAGGPVTVTHPEATRYFMTVSEAVHLILHAGGLGQGGETLVLDMGEPVRIADLARDLIRLQGAEAGRDIEVVYTGLRPGEKLHEEIFAATEISVTSLNPFIFVAWAPAAEGLDLEEELKELEFLVRAGSMDAIKSKLCVLVPQYLPDGVFPEGLAQLAGERT